MHATLLRLLKQTSTAKGPRVTLDHASLTLSTSSSTNEAAEDHSNETREDEEDERQLQPQDHSLIYR